MAFDVFPCALCRQSGKITIALKKHRRTVNTKVTDAMLLPLLLVYSQSQSLFDSFICLFVAAKSLDLANGEKKKMSWMKIATKITHTFKHHLF